MRAYTADELKAAVLAKLKFTVGKDPVAASQRDWFLSVAAATRDIVVDHWIASTNRSLSTSSASASIISSLEFLIGRMLFDAMTNLGIVEPMTAAMAQLGVDLGSLRRVESDAALGNGGLGRLAACFMDSMATLSIAAHGYGIRYDNGLFQADHPQRLAAGGAGGLAVSHGNPWEFERAEVNYSDRLRRLGRGGRGRRRHDAPRLASRRAGRGGRLRHADRRLARPPRQHAAAVVGARA